MAKLSRESSKKMTKVERKPRGKSGNSTVTSQPAMEGPSRREISAHGKCSDPTEFTIPPSRREISTHGEEALVNMSAVEPHDLAFSSRVIAQSDDPHHDNCCGIMTLVNVLDNVEQRRIFCGGNLEHPEAAFVEFVNRVDPTHESLRWGYTHAHMQLYLQHLVSTGKIKRYVFRRLKRYCVEDLFSQRGLDKRLKPGDNLVVFGRARKSDHAAVTRKRVIKEVGKAREKGAPPSELAAVALRTYCQNSSSSCNGSNPSHAVGVRFRAEEAEQGRKIRAELVDPAKEVAKDLSVLSYLDSMAERREVTEEGKQQYEAHYYVFRVEF